MQAPEQRLSIRLAGFSFDPVEGVDLPPELRVEKVSSDLAPYILQFRRSLTREERGGL